MLTPNLQGYHVVSLTLPQKNDSVETYVYRYESIISAPRLLAARSCCYVADCSLRRIPPFVSLPRLHHRNLRQPAYSSLLLRMPLAALRGQRQRRVFEEAHSLSADASKAAWADDEPLQKDGRFRRLFGVPRV